MALFAIADLHLSFSSDKPMDVFGGKWINYEERVKQNWLNVVKEDDTVLIAGDISWAMKWEQAKIDLSWIANLPARKILLRGNHDYWWTSLKKMQEFNKYMNFLQNNYYVYTKALDEFEQDGKLMVNSWAICGTRGWICPNKYKFEANDKKIYERELIRLQLSLDKAKDNGYEKIIVMTHYPPTNSDFEDSGFTDIYEQYGVSKVVYGHLHTETGFLQGFEGERNGVQYQLLSGDYVDFIPQKILD